MCTSRIKIITARRDKNILMKKYKNIYIQSNKKHLGNRKQTDYNYCKASNSISYW